MNRKAIIRHAGPGLLFVWLLLPTSVAQPLAAGPNVAGVGGASAALQYDPYLLSNPASAPADGGPGFTASASRAYGLRELDQLSASVYVVKQSLTVGAVAESFGFERFRRVTVHLVASGLPRFAPVGIRLSYRHLAVAEYGSRSDLACSIGARTSITSRVSVGAMVVNAAMSDPASADFIRRIQFGVRVEIPSRVILYTDVQREEGYPVGLHGGLEIGAGILTLRTGFATSPSSFAFGAGVRIGGLEASTASQRHQPLGWSRTAGVSLDG